MRERKSNANIMYGVFIKQHLIHQYNLTKSIGLSTYDYPKGIRWVTQNLINGIFSEVLFDICFILVY